MTSRAADFRAWTDRPTPVIRDRPRYRVVQAVRRNRTDWRRTTSRNAGELDLLCTAHEFPFLIGIGRVMPPG